MSARSIVGLLTFSAAFSEHLGCNLRLSSNRGALKANWFSPHQSDSQTKLANSEFFSRLRKILRITYPHPV